MSSDGDAGRDAEDRSGATLHDDGKSEPLSLSPSIRLSNAAARFDDANIESGACG